jgi:hypothetical protein
MATSLPSGPNRSEIAIDGTQLDEFLSVEDGREVSALIGLGVKAEMITEVAERDDAPKSRREKVFVPDSSPTHALEVLKQIHKEGMVAPEHVAHRTTLTNLLALKLIKKEKSGRYVPAVSSRYADPLFWMQRAVSSAECIRVARTVLTLNPAAGGREISDAVALELGRKWELRATKLRNGNAIKRWTLWLEPYLIDPDKSSSAAAQVVYSRAKKVTKGRKAVLGKKIVAELRGLVRQGKSKTAIAKVFNVSPATIGNWKRRLRLR